MISCLNGTFAEKTHWVTLAAQAARLWKDYSLKTKLDCKQFVWVFLSGIAFQTWALLIFSFLQIESNLSPLCFTSTLGNLFQYYIWVNNIMHTLNKFIYIFFWTHYTIPIQKALKTIKLQKLNRMNTRADQTQKSCQYSPFNSVFESYHNSSIINSAIYTVRWCTHKQ